MISKDQAHLIADELLEQQRQQSRDAKNEAAKKVPWLYRCAELNRLEPIERVEVIVEARREMRRGLWFALAVFLMWATVFSGFWFTALSAEQRSRFFLVLPFILYVPGVLLHLSNMRLHVKYLARLRWK